MKSNKNLFVKSIAFAFVIALFSFAAIETNAQTLQKAIAAHINKNKEDATEYKQDRKIIYGDVDGDGVKDAVVQYTLEGFGGGNSWGQQLAVFLNKKGAYQAAADETVGGKFFRSFTVLRVANKEIVGATETCPEDEPQGMCKNPAKAQIKLALSGGKLVEK